MEGRDGGTGGTGLTQTRAEAPSWIRPIEPSYILQLYPSDRAVSCRRRDSRIQQERKDRLVGLERRDRERRGQGQLEMLRREARTRSQGELETLSKGRQPWGFSKGKQGRVSRDSRRSKDDPRPGRREGLRIARQQGRWLAVGARGSSSSQAPGPCDGLPLLITGRRALRRRPPAEPPPPPSSPLRD